MITIDSRIEKNVQDTQVDDILKALKIQNPSHWIQVEDDTTRKKNQPTLDIDTWKHRRGMHVRILSHLRKWEFRSITGHLIATIPKNGSPFDDLKKVYSPHLRSTLQRLLDRIHLIVLQDAPNNVEDAFFYRYNNKLILQNANTIQQHPIPESLKEALQKYRHVLRANEERTCLVNGGYVHFKIPYSMHERLKCMQSLQRQKKKTG